MILPGFWSHTQVREKYIRNVNRLRLSVDLWGQISIYGAINRLYKSPAHILKRSLCFVQR